MVDVYEIAQRPKKKGKKAKSKPKPKAKPAPKPQALPRSVKALLAYLSKSDTSISQSSGGRIPQRLQPTEQSITINLAGLERVSAPPAQDVLRSFIAGTKERAGTNVQVAFQQQTYDQVSQLKKQLEEADREQKRYEMRLKQGEDVLGQMQSTIQAKSSAQRQLQQSEAQLRQELDEVKRQVVSGAARQRGLDTDEQTQYKQVRESMGRYYRSQGYALAGQAFGDPELFDGEEPALSERKGASIQKRAEDDFFGVLADIHALGKAPVAAGSPTATYSALSRPDSYKAPASVGSFARSPIPSAPAAPAPKKKKIKLVFKKGSAAAAAQSAAIREQGQMVAAAVQGGGEAAVGLSLGSPAPETPTAKALRARLAELTGTSKSKVKLGVKGRGAGAKYASIQSDVEALQASGLSGGALLAAIKQKHGANISFM